jgi:hypothetical protein
MNSKLKLAVVLILSVKLNPIFSQLQPPIGPTIPNSSPVADLARTAWYRGGNDLGGLAGNRNIFGFSTGSNSPIYFQTDGFNRYKVNGRSFSAATQYSINGFVFASGVNTSGYFLLGNDLPLGSGGTLYNNKGAFSLLHLNGGNFGVVQELGYRTWQKTGVTFTDNSDRAYIGYRNLGPDVNDFVFNWSDNALSPSPGPDNMVFNFTAGAGPVLPSGNIPDLNGDDIDGREVLRLTGFGNVGIGPRFNNTFQPQSTLHQHQENAASSWFQITNQYLLFQV